MTMATTLNALAIRDWLKDNFPDAVPDVTVVDMQKHLVVLAKGTSDGAAPDAMIVIDKSASLAFISYDFAYTYEDWCFDDTDGLKANDIEDFRKIWEVLGEVA